MKKKVLLNLGFKIDLPCVKLRGNLVINRETITDDKLLHEILTCQNPSVINVIYAAGV
jgi:hypothetical protein